MGINKECGSCTMCCKLLGIPEIQKPANQWCENCNVGKGCQIYQNRPFSCHQFDCLWLQLDGIPEEFRPDKTQVVLSLTDHYDEDIVAYCDPGTPDNWRNGAFGKWLLNTANKLSERLFVVCGDDRKVVRLGSVATDKKSKV